MSKQLLRLHSKLATIFFWHIDKAFIHSPLSPFLGNSRLYSSQHNFTLCALTLTHSVSTQTWPKLLFFRISIIRMISSWTQWKKLRSPFQLVFVCLVRKNCAQQCKFYGKRLPALCATTNTVPRSSPYENVIKVIRSLLASGFFFPSIHSTILWILFTILLLKVLTKVRGWISSFILHMATGQVIQQEIVITWWLFV